MSLQINKVNFFCPKMQNNTAAKNYQPKFNSQLLQDTVSFGRYSQTQPVEDVLIRAKDIKKIKNNSSEKIEETFLQKDRLGENIFWHMTPKAIRKSADLLKKTGNEEILLTALNDKNTDGQNILTSINSAKKLDSISYALKDNKEVLTEILSYPSAEEATQTILDNALRNNEDEHVMIKSLNKAWHTAAEKRANIDAAAYNLLAANEKYLNRQNHQLIHGLKH